MNREVKRIYTGAFKNLSIEVMQLKANEPSLELRMNELGIFLYKLKSNTTYAESLVSVDK